MLDASEPVAEIHAAAKQLGDVVHAPIKDGFGDATYGNVIEDGSVTCQEMSDVEGHNG